MNCPRCGKRNDDSSIQCLSCGAGLHLPAPPPPRPAERPAARFTPAAPEPPPRARGPAPAERGDRPPDYLIPAILSTIFCCLPLGGVAVVFALQVGAKSAAGDRAGAVHASQTARRFLRLSFGAGLAMYLVWMVAAVFGGLAKR